MKVKMKDLISQIRNYKMLSCFLLAIIIDYSLYQQHWGWMLALVGALITFFIVINNLNTFKTTQGKLCLGFNILMLFALVEDVSTLSKTMAFLSLSSLGLIRNKIYLSNFETLLRGIRRNIFTMFSRFNRDLFKIIKIKRGENPVKILRLIALSIVPVGLTLIFIFSFAKTNPAMELLAHHLNLESLLELINFSRVLFWLIALSFTWSLIRNRTKLKASRVTPRNYQKLFSYKSVCISLVIFNLLFLTQGLAELSILFDVKTTNFTSSISSSAQEAAYTLLFTAILASLYMLVADHFRKTEGNTIFLKKLIFYWTFQNVFLLFMAIRKLSIYIETYSLTYMRISALIWMYLVAVILILSILKIFLDKNNSWVANIAGLQLLFILTICCFINFPKQIAYYNLNHCREVSGKGSSLDVHYLVSLGEEALPVLREFEAMGNKVSIMNRYDYSFDTFYYDGISNEAEFIGVSELMDSYSAFVGTTSGRSWSFRRHRLNSVLGKRHE